MRNVAAYLFGQVLLWRVRLIFTVALVGDFAWRHTLCGCRHEIAKK